MAARLPDVLTGRDAAAVFGGATVLGGYLGLVDLYFGTIGADEGTNAAAIGSIST